MGKVKFSHLEAGSPLPLGAHITDKGINFAVFSRHATRMALLLYSASSNQEPAEEIALDPHGNRTGDIWHIFVAGLKPGAFYLYRADGPGGPLEGQRFDWQLPLLDPYAKAVSGDFKWDFLGRLPRPKAIACAVEFDWQGDKPLNYPLERCIIYEAHVKGLTQRAGVNSPGSYQGVIEAIPYLKNLNITSLELLPVFEFDEFEYSHLNPQTGLPVKNYWGYSTIGFFAPKSGYSSSGSTSQQINEFKTMVRELHKAGIEVILDVVFNHTAEGNESGPTIHFKGFDNSIYYMLYEDRRYYWNYTGCGNTVNANHPIVRNFIVDCLRYWVVEMHVDGFRFDLASVLTRGKYGDLLDNPPLIEKIAEDPILRCTKLIAEPWDAGGAYQAGSFPSRRFAEWNDRFRDDMRRYWRNDAGSAPAAATRLSGSSDLYAKSRRPPSFSINYITSHDGFTLNDLTSYNYKHNENNGENNKDGSDNNLSWNCGEEGPSQNAAIEELRLRQIKNFLLSLALARGTPMFLGGDEFRRTQNGNNNAYCHDNEISWFDWDLMRKNQSLLRFYQELLALRQRHAVFTRPLFFSGQTKGGALFPDAAWYNAEGRPHPWEAQDNALCCRLSGEKQSLETDKGDNDFLLLLNPAPIPRTFALPPPRPQCQWHAKADTSLPSPQDILARGQSQALLEPASYTLQAHAAAVLIGKET